MDIKRMLASVGHRLISRYEAKSVSPPANLIGDQTIWKTLRVLAQAQGVTNPYEQNVWVYGSLSTIAGNICRTPYRLYVGEDDNKNEVTTGDLYTLFTSPNPLQSWSEVVEATVIYKYLNGQAMWIIERGNNPTAVPKEIWCLNPSRFTIVTDDTTGLPIGWDYKTGNKVVRLGVNDVLWFRFFNPSNELLGMSPFVPASSGIESDYYATEYNKSFFSNGATLSGILSSETSLTEEQFQRIKKQVEERHGGYRKAHSVMIAEGGAKYTANQSTQRDMEFLGLKKLTREEVFAVAKTNAVVLGLFEDVKSYEGIKSAHKQFWLDCILPNMMALDEVIWSKFLSRIDGGKVWGEFDISNVEALKEEIGEKLEQAKSLNELGYTANEINERLNLGMEDLEWGDVWWSPMGLTPVDGSNLEDLLNPKQPAPLAPPKAGEEPPMEEETPPEEMPMMEEEEGKGLLLIRTEGKADYDSEGWKRHLQVQAPIERLMTRKLQRFFFEQRKRVLGNLNANMKKDMGDWIFDEDLEFGELAKLMRKLYPIAIKSGAHSAYTEMGIDFVFDPIEAEYLRIMEMKLQNVPKQILKTISGRLRKTLTEGISKGESIGDLASRVRAEYNMTSRRALTIARTESMSSINGGRYIAMKKNGVEYLRWVTAQDEFVRSHHQELHMMVKPTGSTFGYRLRYPGDPQARPEDVINCRCRTVATNPASEFGGDFSTSFDKDRLVRSLNELKDELYELVKED